ncbi:serine/threonine-protein kinase [Streptomyces iconiensis]|uniref:Serine/threonine-protein kinase n=1 Tax=Streptomyces iconiensis TaxID=1384038 RepID=A0ABT7A667_9ACTN|nr:serine/threonine-protein kinase [Streptomyces iconiensis]MDJ1136331.1 serine/threonine-protein kinase [Streptomyces iconiensis]
MPEPSVSGSELPVGYRLGEWRVTGRIGAGSWGVVHSAESVDTGIQAAVKLLPTHRLPPGQREAMERLVEREVRLSLEADHPHVVRTRASLVIHDADRPELEGATALVMDRAERSLQDVLAQPGQGSGTPVAGAAEVLEGVSAGLAHIHARGWVHGDLKPANVLLAPDGGVWLADFGLTVELEGTHAYVPALGSLDHVPPEWWSDREGGHSVVRATADIWAFGVLAHQALTGGLHPFPGGTARARALAAQAYARGSAGLRLDNGVPECWRALISDCLKPDHASRAVLEAGTLKERVAAACRGADAPAPSAGAGTRDVPGAGVPVGPEPVGGRRASRRRRLAVLAAAIGVPLLGAGAATGALLANDGSGDDGKSPSASPSAPPGTIPADSDVPRELRPVITRAARMCADKEVTPALLAAMLKAESGFDAKAARPREDEYGIAMWTPSVFKGWAVDGDKDGDKDYMSPPDAITTMSSYVCWLDQEFKKEGLRENLPALMAAGYRTSSRTVIDTRGVPARTRDHVNRVERYLKDYTR